MNSAEFMALIGEGPSAPAITTTKNLKASIKNDDALKMKMMISLNDNVLRADGVAVSAEKSNVGEQDNIASETPGDNPAVASVAEKPVDEPLNIEKKADEHAPKIMSENETDTDKSVLDVTVPLHAEVESQTDTSYILCTCSSCKGDFFIFTIMNALYYIIFPL